MKERKKKETQYEINKREAKERDTQYKLDK